jgi:hypothetical protein
MNARITISSLAVALLMGTAGLALADDTVNGKASTSTTDMGKWACVAGTDTSVSTAASSGPAAGIGVANDQTGRETDTKASATVTSDTSAVGRSASGTGLGEKGFRDLLNEKGYTQVTDVQCMNGAWTFHGMQNGGPAIITLNAQTGAFEVHAQ